jgi:CspA family cold shock protein
VSTFPAAVSKGNRMTTGTVKWFSVARKYGFIVPDEGGKDVFVHMSALNTAAIPSLDEGARVSFDLEQTESRRSAVNINVLTPEPVVESAPVAAPEPVETSEPVAASEPVEAPEPVERVEVVAAA